jgi:hypothetical protein
MTTTIKNIDTNKIVEISMADPRTGLDWSADFIGNANDGTGKIGDLLFCADDDDAVYQGDTETVGWWVDYARAYEDADHDAYAAEKESSLDTDAIYEIRESCIGGVEFNDLAAALAAYADELKSREF